jgi:hypothetical protein
MSFLTSKTDPSKAAFTADPGPTQSTHYALLVLKLFVVASSLLFVAYSWSLFLIYSNGQYMTMTDHVIDQYDTYMLTASVLPLFVVAAAFPLVENVPAPSSVKGLKLWVPRYVFTWGNGILKSWSIADIMMVSEPFIEIVSTVALTFFLLFL